jgi:hypothetical protein
VYAVQPESEAQSINARLGSIDAVMSQLPNRLDVQQVQLSDPQSVVSSQLPTSMAVITKWPAVSIMSFSSEAARLYGDFCMGCYYHNSMSVITKINGQLNIFTHGGFHFHAYVGSYYNN